MILDALQRWIEFSAPLRERFSARVRGLALLVLGGVVFKWQVLDAIRLASAGVRPGFFMPVLGIFSLFLVCIAVFMVLFGARGERWLRSLHIDRIDYRNLHVRDVLFLLAVAAPLMVATLWVQLVVEGYLRP